MKIGIVTTSFPRTRDDEAGIFIARFAEALAQEGLSVQIVAPAASGIPLEDRWGQLSIQRVSYGFFSAGSLAYGKGILPNIRSNPLLLLQAPMLLFALARGAIKKSLPGDILHGQWLVSGLAAWLASLVTGAPFLITIRGEDAKLLSSPLLRTFFIPALRKASAIITVSETFLAQLTGQFPSLAHKCRFIPNGISLTNEATPRLKILKELGLSDDSKYLLFTGRIIPLKQLEVLIRLISYQSLSSFQLVAIGKTEDASYLASLRALAESLKCGARVHFCGSKAPQDIPSFLAHASGYLSASSYEGRSNSLLEALAAGKIAAVSDIPGHREVVRHAYNGILFSPHGDLKQTADELAEILSNSEKSAGLSLQAQESVANLSWKATALLHKELYEELLNE